jgi:uncharacterized protein
MPTLITSEFVQAIRKQYQLDWHGVHGVSHWTRVRANGLAIAAANGADRSVVEYFAFLHDTCRRNDGRDKGHGARAVSFAKSIRRNLIQLKGEQFELLLAAIEDHSDERTHNNITIATCWDADRLDLTRIGITPDPTRLCTEAGRQLAQLRERNCSANLEKKFSKASTK